MLCRSRVKKGKRQEAKGKNVAYTVISPIALCLLSFAFCPLPKQPVQKNVEIPLQIFRHGKVHHLGPNFIVGQTGGRCFQKVVFKWTFWRSVAGDLHLGSYRVVCGLWRLAFGIGQFVFKSWFFGALTECAILLQHTRIDTLSIGLGGPWGRHSLAR